MGVDRGQKGPVSCQSGQVFIILLSASFIPCWAPGLSLQDARNCLDMARPWGPGFAWTLDYAVKSGIIRSMCSVRSTVRLYKLARVG
jgi:hypothetical protein